MKRAILTHRRDFAAVASLVVAAVVVVIYILVHQPSFTFGHSYYTVKAQFANAAAVTAGQGQAVTIAGVPVGQVGGVGLQDGNAVVTMDIEKKYSPIYRNATVLLRPRTPLKDMYLALDPGTRSAGTIPSGGTLPVANTSPTVDFDDVLSALDTDTRNYLLLLLAAGSQAFRDPGNPGPVPSPAAVADLSGTLKRFEPLNRDTRTFTSLLATRQQNLRRSIHNLQLVANALGGVDTQLTSLIRSSNTNFQAISSQDANLEAALSLFPGTLNQTTQTLGKVRAFASQSGTTLQALLPFAHEFGPALQASQPLFRDTTPVIQNQLRPFSVAVQPLARTLEPAATQLARGIPPLSRSFDVLNGLFNALADGGQHSFLFWGSWLAHNVFSLTDLQDANGPVVRGLFMGQCTVLNLDDGLAVSYPSLAPLIDLLNAPDYEKVPDFTNGACAGGV